MEIIYTDYRSLRRNQILEIDGIGTLDNMNRLRQVYVKTRKSPKFKKKEIKYLFQMAIDELKSIVDDSLDKLCNDKLSDNFCSLWDQFRDLCTFPV